MSTPAPTTPAAPPPLRPAAKVSALVKSFGTTRALDGISATLPAGEILGLVGPDGAWINGQTLRANGGII